nr:MAG TPA: rhamnogalacturonase A [Caudoviricetes sp.]
MPTENTNTAFIKLKPINELEEITSLQPGNLLFEDGDGNLKRITTDLFYQILNNFARPLAPGDTPPSTANRWYKPTTSSADPGTNYPNAGNLKAKSGFDTLFFYDGTNWIKAEVALPGVSISPDFDPTTEIKAQGGKQIVEYFSSVKEIVGSTIEITNRTTGGYIDDNAQFVATSGYTTTGLVNVANSEKIQIQNFSPPTEDYSVKFYNSNNSVVLNHRQKGTYEIVKPSDAVKFQVSYFDFSGSVNFKLFTVQLAGTVDLGTSSIVDESDELIKYKPVNSVGIAGYLESEISQFSGELNIEGFYETNIKALKISIDDFTGTDDERIEKATAMIENVGGGQIYFPNRQINITKAILIPSNTRFILDNCQIQMANNIHDNIFRSKGVKINPSSPNGVQTEAYWTENFEIIGVGMPTIRQSVTPLHTGDFYGWRGVSVLLARCRNYKLKNLKVIESHMWSISNEFSERGYFENLEFANTLHPNADGLNFRNGCKNMYAKTLRGTTNDNAVATTILDSTIPSSPGLGYSYQCLGWTFGDYWGAENIIVEDVQVKSKYGSGLILGTSRIVKNITYKDFVSTVSSGSDWDNVSVCGNNYRTFIYGTSYVDGNVHNINIVNSNTSVHEYSLGVYGGKIEKLFTNKIINTKLGKLGDVKNDTATVIVSY